MAFIYSSECEPAQDVLDVQPAEVGTRIKHFGLQKITSLKYNQMNFVFWESAVIGLFWNLKIEIMYLFYGSLQCGLSRTKHEEQHFFLNSFKTNCALFGLQRGQTVYILLESVLYTQYRYFSDWNVTKNAFSENRAFWLLLLSILDVFHYLAQWELKANTDSNSHGQTSISIVFCCNRSYTFLKPTSV